MTNDEGRMTKGDTFRLIATLLLRYLTFFPTFAGSTSIILPGWRNR
jgi:hypothetical protein